MTRALFLTLTLLSSSAFSARIQLNNFDQLKLARFVESLPANIKDSKTLKAKLPENGKVIVTRFPQKSVSSSGFFINCESSFYNQSPYATASTCELEVDLAHPEVKKSNDELRLNILQKDLVQGLYDSISYGKPRKEIRSYGKEWGTNFAGDWTYVFHYYLSCSTVDCQMTFSQKALP